MDRNSDDAASKATVAREREVGIGVRSLFKHCERSSNPVLAYSRACSKVGYLARDGVRSEFHYLESALNERKHALVMERYGQREKAREHNQNCGRDLRAFQRAIRAELDRVRDPHEGGPEPSVRGLSGARAVERAEARRQGVCGVESERTNGTGLAITARKERGLDR